MRVDWTISLIFLFITLANAIKFDLSAAQYPESKCIWHYANADTLVVVTANVNAGPKQRVDVEILDGSKERFTYLHKKDIKGETRLAVTTHQHADIGVCFSNYLIENVPAHTQNSYESTIDLDIDVGAEAIDYNAIANQENLSTIETDMRKLEQMTREIVADMNYLKKREERMRDTNESTNTRVKNFGMITLAVLFVLGVWQVSHLRSYFRRKYLI